MAKFILEWVEVKSPDWKVVSIKPEIGDIITDVSLNKTSKKGEVFPNFDAMKAGDEISGELWTSPAGKNYLFPPKPEVPKNMQRGSGAINKAMETKNLNIEKFQGNKMLGVKSSSTIRMAVDLTIATLRNEDIIDNSVIKGMILEWRKWLWSEFEKEDKDFPPFN